MAYVEKKVKQLSRINGELVETEKNLVFRLSVDTAFTVKNAADEIEQTSKDESLTDDEKYLVFNAYIQDLIATTYVKEHNGKFSQSTETKEEALEELWLQQLSEDLLFDIDEESKENPFPSLTLFLDELAQTIQPKTK